MTSYIVSEEQAERVGERITGGSRGSHFDVYWYEHRQTRLTLFGTEIISTGRTVAIDDPSAAVSA